jgi:kexin
LAKEYENPTQVSLLPPPESNDTVVDETPRPSTTKSHPKPTANLPDDHGSRPGENDKPAFDAAEPSSTPTPDEGWFPDMASLLNNKKWFFGVVAVVLLFCIGAGAYFWRRRILRRRRAQYSALGGDDMAMRHIPGEGGTPRTRELYDAFGEVSDDEDADEETGLRGGRPQDRSPGGLGFHQGFLDDDDPPSAPHDGGYKDEPDPVEVEEKRENADSPDGSWEHASQSR